MEESTLSCGDIKGEDCDVPGLSGEVVDAMKAEVRWRLGRFGESTVRVILMVRKP